MEEKQKCKKCWNCGNYGAYYTKGFCYFDKTKHGFCAKHHEMKEKHDHCEFWKKSNDKPNIDLKMIDKVIADTEELKHIYEEEN